MTTSTPVVLAVDDDEEVLETYNIWLYDECSVRLATDGQEALDKLDDEVDVVLLDRMMSGLSGQDVLERIRALDGEYRVIMVTAVDPDLDIVEMDFDAYLPKPMPQDELVEMIHRVNRRREYSETVQEYLALRSTKVVLDDTKDKVTLNESEEYARLKRRIEEFEEQHADELADIDTDSLL